MDDPKLVTDLAEIGAAAWASKELAGKILGPTFEYIGGEVRTFAQKCNINLTDVFRRARRKLAGREETAGGVDPRIAKEVLEQAAFCEDAVAAEYVAGVLASSRSEDSRDDRGMAYLAVIRQLSRNQLRLHYLIYSSLKALLVGETLSALNPHEAPYMQLFLPLRFLRENCELAQATEHVQAQQALNALARNDLIASAWWGGDEEFVHQHELAVRQAGYFVTPTGFGVELFLWAHGGKDIEVSEFLKRDLTIEPLPDLVINGLPLHIPDRTLDDERERQRRQLETEALVRQTIAARRQF